MGGVASRGYQAAATALAAVVSFVPTASLAAQAAPDTAAAGLVQGRVLDAATGKPLPGAVVHLRDPHTGALYSSPPTTAAGSFRVDRIPPATYDLAVEAEGGLFLGTTPVRVETATAAPLNLAVQRGALSAAVPRASATPAVAAQNPDDETGEEDQSGEEETKKKKRRYASPWDNPLTATLIVLGAAVVIGAIVDNLTEEEEAPPASPSLPAP